MSPILKFAFSGLMSVSLEKVAIFSSNESPSTVILYLTYPNSFISLATLIKLCEMSIPTTSSNSFVSSKTALPTEHPRSSALKYSEEFGEGDFLIY